MDEDYKLVNEEKMKENEEKIDTNIEKGSEFYLKRFFFRVFNGYIRVDTFFSVQSEEHCTLSTLESKNPLEIHDTVYSCVEESLTCKEVVNLVETSVIVPPKKIEESGVEGCENAESDTYDGSENTDTISDWMHLNKGRYFGAAEDEVICHKCGEPGHILRECSQEMCTNCGTVNDHLASRCPMLQKCHNCNELGHILVDCKKPRKSNTCSSCNSKYHPDDRQMCPKIWRCYIFNPDAPKDFKPRRYCYNCAEYGHYGDDCRLPQFSRYLEPSAFRIDNEPISSSEYAYMKRQEKIKKKRAIQAYKDEEKDDWFARKMKKMSSHKSSKLDTFSKSSSRHKISYSSCFYNESRELLYNDRHKYQNNKHDKKWLKQKLK
ncbi:hypothetical protein PORY_002146 [Pneumocystis oryctolagi]|uniref:Uncharacterized protein n=1 Tax=Pneumocystis oryctolagi TaxID=42067 RepID=A0ACB7CA69_9ASCO|nr:hypothetical protein PORY_002146 [Pneumocystis oryctolagi]